MRPERLNATRSLGKRDVLFPVLEYCKFGDVLRLQVAFPDDKGVVSVCKEYDKDGRIHDDVCNDR